MDIDCISTRQGKLKPEVYEALRQVLTDWEAPDYLVESKLCHHAMLILLTPCSQGNLGAFFANVKEIKPSLPSLSHIFCKIFRENSIRLRREFFRSDLVQHMWRKYYTVRSHEIKSYLITLKGEENEL